MNTTFYRTKIEGPKSELRVGEIKMSAGTILLQSEWCCVQLEYGSHAMMYQVYPMTLVSSFPALFKDASCILKYMVREAMDHVYMAFSPHNLSPFINQEEFSLFSRSFSNGIVPVEKEREEDEEDWRHRH